jgi:predicted nucleic acid-binding protein
LKGNGLDRQVCSSPLTFVLQAAVRRGITLVTANTREFKRVDGLMWEDWARPLKRNR